MRLLVTLVFLTACTQVDQGGNIQEYMRKAQTYTRELPKVCQSACTMFLYRGCVTPEHELLFHSPRVLVAGAMVIHMTEERREQVSREMSRYYPPEIARKWMDEWSKDWDGVTITGQEAIDMGARACS